MFDVRIDPETGRAGVWIEPEPGRELTPDLVIEEAKRAAAKIRYDQAYSELRRKDLRYELLAVWHGKVTDIYLATLAWAYTEIVKTPGLNVIPTLAEMLGRSPNTIKMHVVRARDRGFLTRDSKWSGGELTPAAETLLRKHVEETHPEG